MSLVQLISDNKIISDQISGHQFSTPQNNIYLSPHEIVVHRLLFVTSKPDININELLEKFDPTNIFSDNFVYKNEHTRLEISFTYIHPWTQYL